MRATDADGTPLAGAQAFFFEAGTTTALTVYSDTGLSTAHPRPLVADANGIFPPVYSGLSTAKVELQDADDNVLSGYPIDPIAVVQTEPTAAQSISFDPTVNIPADDVREAILQVQQNIGDQALSLTGNSTVTGTVNFTGATLSFANDQIAGGVVAEASTTTRGTVEKSTSAENTAGTQADRYPDVVGAWEISRTGNRVFQSTLYAAGNDGAQESVSITLEQGFEYLFVIGRLAHGEGTDQPLNMRLTKASDSTEHTFQIGADIPSTDAWLGEVETELFSSALTALKQVKVRVGNGLTIASGGFASGRIDGGSDYGLVMVDSGGSRISEVRIFAGATLGDANLIAGTINVFKRAVG